MQLGGGGAEPECVTLIPVAMRSLEGLRADPLWNKFRSSAENRVKHGSVCENSLRGGAETTRGLMKPPRCHSYHHEEEKKAKLAAVSPGALIHKILDPTARSRALRQARAAR